MTRKIGFYSLAIILSYQISYSQDSSNSAKLINVANGWAKNSVNVVVFRKNSLVTYRTTQFVAFYDENSSVVLGKRKIGSEKWTLAKTQYKGNTNDAHNMISIVVDGDGYLHMAWDHHNNRLHYCRSQSPLSLELTNEMPMTGIAESSVSYPEFYKLPNGKLIFLYRDGASGRGNLVINQYNPKRKLWTQVQQNLIDGEGARSAYWQACVDKKGVFHLSWVWRETPDVESNHDLCYAKSKDGGVTWQKSTGEKYALPINYSTAEELANLPQGSGLINQTSMCVDEDQNPYIVTYMRDVSLVPQYFLFYRKDGKWNKQETGFRKSSFKISGAGTKRIPISRPQVIAWGAGNNLSVAIIYRDIEREDKVSIAMAENGELDKWKLFDLTNFPVGSWEPTYDTELWKSKKKLDIFVQKVEQADSEGQSQLAPQPVQVLEWRPKK